MLNCAHYFLTGIEDGTPNYNKAFESVESSANNHRVAAYYMLSFHYFIEILKDKLLKIFKKKIGNFYEEGHDDVCQKDAAKCISWRKKAAFSGHAHAAYQMGMMFLRGAIDPRTGTLSRDERAGLFFLR